MTSDAHPATPDQFFKFAKTHQAEMVDLKFVDMLGSWQHCSFPIEHLDASTFEEGLGFDGSSIRGWMGIHESDMNRLFVRGLTDAIMQGTYIATAPRPVSNAEFMRELRRAIRMQIVLPAQEWMVRIGAPLFLWTDPVLALYGRYCVSRRLKEEGFEFCFPELRGALTDLFGRHKHGNQTRS